MNFFSKKPKRKESLNKISKLINPPDGVHDLNTIHKNVKERIKEHNLDNNIVLVLKEPEGFFKIEIKNLELIFEMEPIAFDVYYREITFKKNEIKFSPGSIEIDISNTREPSEQHIDIFFHSKVFKFIENKINRPLFFTESSDKNHVTDIVLSNNKIKGMIFHLSEKNFYKLFFLEKNEIDNLGEIPENMSFQFDHNQKIDKKGLFPEKHKKLFLELKKRAIKDADKVLESIFIREIMECERKILAKKGLYSAYSDKFILCVEKYISNYGFSWLRPLLWLFFANGIFSAIIKYYIPCAQSIDGYNIFWNFFDPLFNVAQLCNACEKSTGIAMVKVFQKVIFAFLGYEIIKAFRRFSRK